MAAIESNRYAALRNKILAGMIVIPAVPFILLILIGYYYLETSLHKETMSLVERIVEDHRQTVELFLDERKGDLRFIAESFSPEELANQEVLGGIFRNLQSTSEAFTDLGVFNQAGVHVAYVGPYELAGKNYSDAPWFQEALKRDFYTSDVFLGYRGIPHFIIAVVKRHEGRIWIIRATIDTSFFSQVVERVRIGKTGEAYLLNREGLFQTQRRSGGELMAPDRDLEPQPVHGEVKTMLETDARNTKYLYATVWLNNKDWLLVARQEEAEAFEDLNRVTWLAILVTVAGGLLIVGMAFNTTHRIIGRLELVDTEKKELGRQLVVAGRLAEIGEMSAGFAHEINNPLQVIKSELTLIDVIMDDLKAAGQWPATADTAQVADSLAQIQSQVNRCGAITQGLLKFSRKKESQPSVLNLKVFLPEVVRLIENKAGVEGIKVNLTVAENAPPILADAALLEQVIVNLLNNAIYAVVEQRGSSGGEIHLDVRNSPENGQVAISVTDNGSGISPENMEKIFTPFFTTKPVGQGTGLGLPICYGIVSEMGGVMEVASEKGAGTTFTIRLKKEE